MIRPLEMPPGPQWRTVANSLGPVDAARWLPRDFWDGHPTLAAIRQAAHCRMLSADAVLHAVLSRVAGTTSHTVKLPAVVGAPCPLSYYAAIVGPSGDGKSSSYRAAAELVPAGCDVADQLPIGSGEGLVEALFEWVDEEDPESGKSNRVKKQTRFNATIYVDEGEALGAIGGRSGSTTLATLRAAWTGGVLGNANASTERKRIVPAGAYVYGLVVAIQPTLAGPLLADTAAGTPQRFSWASSSDPTIPDIAPDWPELAWTAPGPGQLYGYRTRNTTAGYATHLVELDPDIVAEVRAYHLARQRGQVQTDPQDSHRYLRRLKTAALLALLCDRDLTVTPHHWRLAGTVADVSDQVRRNVENAVAEEAARVEHQSSTRQARRAVHAAALTDRHNIAKGAEVIARRVRRQPGISWSELRRSLGRNHRDVAVDALDHAIGEGWVVEKVQPGQGADRRALYPTESDR